MTSTVGVVVLTQGTRPADLRHALASVQAQRGVELDIVVVGNGWEPVDLPTGVRGHGLPENIGIPAGRNAGTSLVSGEYLLFVDDDAALLGDDFLERGLAKFLDDPELGILQPRVVSTDGSAPTRWIPRLRKGDPARSSNAFSLWEGVVLARRNAYDAVGGWPAEFFYAHEGIELAWRFWDSGYQVWYAGDLECSHPPINPTRHAAYFELNARNRVWLARRNLPWVFAIPYVVSWTLVQMLRTLSSAQTRSGFLPWWRGWLAGWTENPGERRVIKWRTIAKMTRLGRPPVI